MSPLVPASVIDVFRAATARAQLLMVGGARRTDEDEDKWAAMSQSSQKWGQKEEDEGGSDMVMHRTMDHTRGLFPANTLRPFRDRSL